MKKEDFKTVRGVATMANMSLAMYISVLIILVIWLFFDSSTGLLMLMLCFVGLYLVTAILGVISSKKLTYIKFEGTSKILSENAHKQSFLIFFPVIFAVTMGRVRGAMWDFYITEKTSHISDPVEQVRVNREILEEVFSDGFISRYQYDEKVAKYSSEMEAAEHLKKEIAKEKARAKKAKKTTKEEDWI